MPKYNVYFNSEVIYTATVEAENEDTAKGAAHAVIFDSDSDPGNFIDHWGNTELGKIELANDDAEITGGDVDEDTAAGWDSSDERYPTP